MQSFRKLCLASATVAALATVGSHTARANSPLSGIAGFSCWQECNYMVAGRCYVWIRKCKWVGTTVPPNRSKASAAVRPSPPIKPRSTRR